MDKVGLIVMEKAVRLTKSKDEKKKENQRLYPNDFYLRTTQRVFQST